MRSGVIAIAAFVAAAVLAILLVAARDERDVAYAVGLPAIGPADRLEQGDELCRRSIEVPTAFQRVRVVTVTDGLPGPPLAVTVRPASGGGDTARARVAGGYPGGTVEARVGSWPAGARVTVCVRNLGVNEVVLLGLPPGVLLGDLGDVSTQVQPGVVFVRDRPVATLSQVPEMLRRAALFKPVAPWHLWLLLALVVLGLPTLLAAALRSTRPAPRAVEPAPQPPPAAPAPRPEEATARRE
jgi:hypothetical protein